MNLGDVMKQFLETKLMMLHESKHDVLEDACVYFSSIHRCSMKRLSYNIVLNHFKEMILWDVKTFRVYYPYRTNIEFLYDCLRFYRKNYDPGFEIPGLLRITNDLPAYCKRNKLLGSRYRHLLQKREDEEKIVKKKLEERRRRKRKKHIAKANNKRRRERVKDQKLKRHLSIMAYLGKAIHEEIKEIQ